MIRQDNKIHLSQCHTHAFSPPHLGGSVGSVSVTFHRQDGMETRVTEPGGVRGNI